MNCNYFNKTNNINFDNFDTINTIELNTLLQKIEKIPILSNLCLNENSLTPPKTQDNTSLNFRTSDLESSNKKFKNIKNEINYDLKFNTVKKKKSE